MEIEFEREPKRRRIGASPQSQVLTPAEQKATPLQQLAVLALAGGTGAERKEEEEAAVNLSKTCDDGYVRREPPLGRGSFGIVYQACKPPTPGPAGGVQQEDCNYVLKVINLTSADAVDAAARESYFLPGLQAVTLNGTYIVPRFYGNWTCLAARISGQAVRQYVLALEKFDGDLLNMTRQQVANVYAPLIEDELAKIRAAFPAMDLSDIDNVVLSEADFLRIFGIARALSICGVAFSDLKLDQFLYRGAPEVAAPHQVVITDFGFAGDRWGLRATTGRFPPDWGWTAEQLGCPLEWNEMIDGVLAPYLNYWQLESDLTRGTFTWVLVTDPESKQPTLRLFGGLTDLPDYVRTLTAQRCPEDDAEFTFRRLQLVGQVLPLYTLSLAQIEQSNTIGGLSTP